MMVTIISVLCSVCLCMHVGLLLIIEITVQYIISNGYITDQYSSNTFLIDLQDQGVIHRIS